MANIVSTGRTISTAEYLEKKRRVRRKKNFIFLSLFFLLLVALVIISRLPNLQIKEVAVSGALATGPDPIVASVAGKLAGRYFWLIPRSNAFVYGKNTIKSDLYKEFPRFSLVALTLEGLNKLEVSVTEREPLALYCATPEACWFLDKEGFIFDEAPSFSEGVYFEYRSATPLERPLGNYFMPRDEFMALHDFLGRLSPLGFEPLLLSVESDHLAVNMENGSKLILGKANDLSRAFVDLKAFLGSSQIKSEKDFLARVSELDLRTKDKVFYRFK